jgi:hypothetical protein
MKAAKCVKETISTKNFELIKSSWKKNKKFKTETANFQVNFILRIFQQSLLTQFFT